LENLLGADNNSDKERMNDWNSEKFPSLPVDNDDGEKGTLALKNSIQRIHS